jgi:hypothetical protein
MQRGVLIRHLTNSRLKSHKLVLNRHGRPDQCEAMKSRLHQSGFYREVIALLFVGIGLCGVLIQS